MRSSVRAFPPLLGAVLLALAATTAGIAAAAPAAPRPTQPTRQYTLDQLLTTVGHTDTSSFSPDGSKVLVSSDETGTFNAFAIPVAGGKPVQLTDSKVNAIRVIGYFPADERFLYSSDQGGDERTHLYVQSPGGAVRDLTPGDGLKAEFISWVPDGRSFFFRTNERDPKLFDAYEMTVDGYERKLLFQNENGYMPEAVSPDRRYVALSFDHHEADVDTLLYDRQSGQVRTLLESPGADVVYVPEAFSGDGKGLFYITDEGDEFRRMMRYDLATGAKTEVLRTNWDVSYIGESRDGRYLAAGINRDARTELQVFDTRDLKPVPFPTLPDTNIANGIDFSQDGRRVVFQAETSNSPADVYVHDLGSREPRRLTHSLNPAIDPADLTPAEVVRFKSYDGVEIPGLLYKPLAASPGHKVPALLLVHGGPGGQSRVGYRAMTQYLTNHGYAVYAINNRGSEGYGKTFYHLDDRKHGNADLDDCVASKKMLAATGWVDPDRIGIAGGSYGGYMVLAALTFRPREFAVGVDLYGVANWIRTLQSVPSWWETIRSSLYKELGDPVKDEEYLRKISPLFHAENIERPLIVLQGEKDPRVLKRESDEIVAAARKRGTPVEYIILPNEGHGFQRKESQKKAYEAMLAFLDRYLKGGSSA